MLSLDLMLGPALEAVEADDTEGLADLAREQRGRLATIRHEGIWHWMGGVPGGERETWPLFGALTFMALVPVLIVSAAFYQGPWLWAAAGLTVACALPHVLVVLPTRRRGQRILRRMELRPAVVLAADGELGDPGDDRWRALHALVGPALGTPKQLRALVAAGDQLAAVLAGEAAASGELGDFAAQVRARIDADVWEGRRWSAPEALGTDLAVTHLRATSRYFPGEHMTSRLLFLLVDPHRDGPDSTRFELGDLWGEGVASLLVSFPWEPPA